MPEVIQPQLSYGFVFIQLEYSSFRFSSVSACKNICRPLEGFAAVSVLDNWERKTGKVSLPWGCVTLTRGRFYRRTHMFTQTLHICAEPLWTAVGLRGQDRTEMLRERGDLSFTVKTRDTCCCFCGRAARRVKRREDEFLKPDSLVNHSTTLPSCKMWL